MKLMHTFAVGSFIKLVIKADVRCEMFYSKRHSLASTGTEYDDNQKRKFHRRRLDADSVTIE